MNPLSSNDKTYTVSGSALSWSLTKASLTTQSPSCGYSESYSISMSPAFNSASAPTLTDNGSTIKIEPFYTTNLADAGTKIITVTSTLQNYNVEPAASAPTVSKTITVVIPNPCDSATVVVTSHPTFSTSVHVSASSSTPLWYDSYSGSASQ